MIEASGLTKTYGQFTALNAVSFVIQPGEVVGLLGPNGAGKSTMLKLLTGYLPATAGSARMANLDVSENALAVRRRVGYLPETNPLYEELSVYESLQWTARLRGIEGAAAALAIRHVVGVCGLTSAVSKDVAHLSKGYRQRLGLAQAILHDPEILILDEPTSGLDPNQQSEVRALIQTLKQKKTVLLSTHILSEAKTSCDRVLIIHQGKIVADGSPESLSQSLHRGQRLQLELKAPGAQAREALSLLPGADSVQLEREGEGRSFLVIESRTSDLRESIFALAVQNRWTILQLTEDTASLEEVFRQLTTS